MTDKMVNEILVDGTHFMYSMMSDLGELQVHPALSMLFEVYPSYVDKITVRPMVEHTVIRAVRGEDKFEVILLRHDFPHDTLEEQEQCDQHPYLIIRGGIMEEYPYTERSANVFFDAFVDAAEENGGKLLPLI